MQHAYLVQHASQRARDIWDTTSVTLLSPAEVPDMLRGRIFASVRVVPREKRKKDGPEDVDLVAHVVCVSASARQRRRAAGVLTVVHDVLVATHDMR